MKLRVGTRRSPLALTQTRQAMDLLVRARPDVTVELVEIVTTGDRIRDRPLREAGGKGLFLKELDEALMAGAVDCAVHSLKDVPSELAPGTEIAAVLRREDPRDVLVTMNGTRFEDLADGALVGTTSLRRSSQLLRRHPRCRVAMLRGNVETRLRRVVEGGCDATFLAAAGLVRLGLDPAPALTVALDPFQFVPAPGQGALAVTTRSDDSVCRDLLATLEDSATRAAVTAERAFARAFGGGCHLPLAAYAKVDRDGLALVGLLLAPDGSDAIRDEIRGVVSSAEDLGRRLGEAFFARGARRVLAVIEESSPT